MISNPERVVYFFPPQTEHSSLVAHRSSLIARRSSLVAHRSSLIARLSSLVARRSSLIARRSSLVAHRSALPHIYTTSEFQNLNIEPSKSTQIQPNTAKRRERTNL